MILHIDVGRERSIFAIERALEQDGLIFLATQKETSIENPKLDDLYNMGTFASVKSIKELDNGAHRVLIEGIARAEWTKYKEDDLFPVVDVTTYQDSTEVDIE